MILVINLKTYHFGKNAFELVKKISKASKKIIIAAQPTDIYAFSKKFNNPIYAQHADYFEPGRNTGFITLESIKAAGAKGTSLNHSEHKLKMDVLKRTIKRCKKLKLKTLVCASNLNEAKKIMRMNPEMMAYEPKELIGTGVSVSTTKPDIVEKFANLLKGTNIIPLCGAGITNKRDVEIAEKLGCKGILVASAVTKSKNPGMVLKELLID